ncbi:MAG: hypothetical protein ACYS80_17160 [Planctomycetota bacterium]|jgi:hypothetical protein
MNLVRWFRKNNKKVMAVVVIVIMIGFIGGSSLTHFLRSDRGLNSTIAYLGEKGEITNYDLFLARRELDILRTLRLDELLRRQDLQGILLGELLFSGSIRGGSPALINRIKQSIRANQYRISDKQINDIYSPGKNQAPPNIYWYCLQTEAQLAGINVTIQNAGELLGMAIPQLFNGQTYSQIIGSIMNQYRVPEEQILTTVSNLLAVLQYSHMICSNEDVTIRQIMQALGTEEETIDVELVKFDSDVFTSSIEQPASDIEQEHFNKYRKLFAGSVSDENPYGLGYKLPDRVQLEYIAIRLDDIQAIVTPPTQDEVGEYYDRYKEQRFTEQIPSDPNDPNSPLTPRTKSYAEVAGIISEQLLKNKINTTAEGILREARTLTEAGLEDTDIEPAKMTVEQLKELAGDYVTAAEQLSGKHNIKVYVGRTGLLSPIDMQTDEHLATLFLQGYGFNPVSLTQVVFAVDELAASELGPFDVPKPRMYENIGPVKDLRSELKDGSGPIMAIVRVINVQKASEPESINQTFSTSSLKFDPNEEKAGEDVYSVKEKVVEDLKKLAAMDATQSKAGEFIDLATKDGWDSAIDQFNELYKQQEKQDDDPNAFRLQPFTGLRRMSQATLETLAVQSQGNPAAPFYLDESKKQRRFVEQLYSLVPPDKNTVEALPVVMEFKQDMSYYVIKNISIKRLWKEDYERIKSMRLYREDHVQSQSLAVVHFNPENIFKRMNFRPAEADEEPADTTTPAESEAASQ